MSVTTASGWRRSTASRSSLRGAHGCHHPHLARVLEQAAGPLAHEVVVLCEHHQECLTHRNEQAVVAEAWPLPACHGRERFSTRRRPPIASMRSLRPVRLEPLVAAGSKPTPSSSVACRAHAATNPMAWFHGLVPWPAHHHRRPASACRQLLVECSHGDGVSREMSVDVQVRQALHKGLPCERWGRRPL